MIPSSENYIIPIVGGYRPRPISLWQGAYSLSSIAAEPSDGGIEITVDWSGRSEDLLGTFSVLTSSGGWEHCNNISPGDRNDLIYYPAVAVSGSLVYARLTRGPANSNVVFHAKALPIVWNPNKKPSRFAPSSDFTVTRGDHYSYAVPDPYDQSLWRKSLPNNNGVQQVTLDLTKGEAYEIWVNLKHPSKDAWLFQDPVVTGDNGGGGG